MYAQIPGSVLTADKNKLNAFPASSRLAEISGFLKNQGTEAYLVGGFVRDTLLERETADIDIAVAGDALIAAKRIAEKTGGTYVELDDVNRIGRVVFGSANGTEAQFYFDFTSLRGSIMEDLAQRDFTIDAIALPLDNRTSGWIPADFIDPFGGMKDITTKTIRAVNPGIFKADPARLMRAVRLSAQLGFTIKPGTASLIKSEGALIQNVAGERLREELVRILAVPASSRYIFDLEELGLLTQLIPELAQARNVEQPIVHYWDVFQHSMQTTATADFILGEDSYKYPSPEALAMVPWTEEVSNHFKKTVGFGTTRRSLFILAALLHDIAKPESKFVDDEGHTRFFGHTSRGATVASEIMMRLRFSAREITVVESMVENHMRPNQMSNEGLPTRRAIYRFFRDTGECGIDILYLSLADHMAARGPGLDLTEWKRHTDLVRFVLQQRSEEEKLPYPVNIINGNDIMNEFNIPAGPEIGRLIEAVREARAAGEIATRDEAINYVKMLIRNSAS